MEYEWIIRAGIALAMFAFGIEQLLKPSRWTGYIPPLLSRLLPTSPNTTMRMHAVGNIVLGIWLAIGFYHPVILWLAFLWWLSILPFALWRDWRVGLRDLAITLTLLVLVLQV
jgi:hypothetical protein